MLRVGPLAIVAMLIAAAGSFVPFSAMAGPEQSEEPEVVVVTLPSRSQLASPSASSDPTAGPLSQVAIAREAQKELRRLGCYEGESSGIWTPSSRLAAQRFVDRVNAKLPTDKPDEFLLALLRDQSGAICSQCLRDEALDASGRCMPVALISKPATPRSIVTSALSDTPSTDRPLADQTQAPPQTTTTRRPIRSTRIAGKSWNRWIRKVDRALGLY
jgi:hypothetical protein